MGLLHRHHRDHRIHPALDALLALLLAVAILLVAAPRAHAVLLEGEYSNEIQRREGHQPSLGAKLLGYSNYVTALEGAPDTIILGTSRAVQLDPRLVKRVSGHTTYNAGTSDGAARELLAFSSFVELLSPGDAPHLVVLFDIEGLDRRTPTRRVVETIHTLDAARAACGEPVACAGQWQAAARDLLATAKEGQVGMPPYRSVVRYDGMQINGNLEKMDRDGVDLVGVRNRRIGIRIQSYKPTGGFNRLMPIPMNATRKMIALANARGDTPTIVLTSMHPECIRRCGPAGWFARRKSTLAFFAQVKADGGKFTLVNATNPASWGGTSASFFDEIHLRPEAAARLVKWLDTKGVWGVQVTAPLLASRTSMRTQVAAGGADARGFLDRAWSALDLVAREA